MPSRRLAIALTRTECDDALLAIGRFVDLKSPFTIGHSDAVAELVGRRRPTGSVCPMTRRSTMYRAGLVHDFGRLGVSNSIWDKRGPLGAGEWERVRLLPVLHRADAAAVADARARSHGSPCNTASGSTAPAIHAASPAARISPLARILGAADAYQAMREPRPYRPRTISGRRRRRAAGRRAGRPARLRRGRGRARRRRPSRRAPTRGPCRADRTRGRGAAPAARGLSNKEIAAQLVISPKTAGNHIEHIYTKIGTSNRAERQPVRDAHGLLPEEGFPTKP